MLAHTGNPHFDISQRTFITQIIKNKLMQEKNIIYFLGRLLNHKVWLQEIFSIMFV